MKKLLLLVCLLAMTTITTAFTNGNLDIDEENKEDMKILQEERQKRKEELQQTREITDDMYAAFFRWDDGSIDAAEDVTIADNYFSSMNYITEPTYYDIDRRYAYTDILLFAGHGLSDRVYIRPAPSERTYENDTGIHTGSTKLNDGDTRLIGVGKRGFPQSRFVMLAACESAYTSNNIAKYSVQNGAESAIGWQEKVSSEELHKWEKLFFNQIQLGKSLREAKEIANDHLRKTEHPDVLTSRIYGNDNIRLSKDRSKSTNNQESFTYVNKTLNIDCANKNLDELTEYLEKNVQGFHKENCKIELISQTGPDDDDYTILYGLQYNGFKTPYKVLVYVYGKEIKYSSNLDEFNNFVGERNIVSNISNEIIETAKQEAIKVHNIDEKVECQEVEKILDKNFQPYISVKTVYVDENGAKFAKEYKYSIS